MKLISGDPGLICSEVFGNLDDKPETLEVVFLARGTVRSNKLLVLLEIMRLSDIVHVCWVVLFHLHIILVLESNCPCKLPPIP